MYLGIDVGGTHTDAVVVEKDLSVVAAAKATTVEPVAESLREVLRELAKSVNLADSIKRLTISTTLGLNRVLTGKSDPVGIIVTSGPGLDLEPAEGAYGGLFKQVTGSQDHRGQVLAPINPKEVELAVKDFASKGAKALVLASKFGPKNPELEESLGKVASDNFKGPIM
ncbi:MAG: hydantoinase/oxoprolinase family protein, partial [Deltaproteobacteria bacterium]|nr:hydantoinase/oxoprolinase family protein [Deltaproteobacteria bacterium]